MNMFLVEVMASVLVETWQTPKLCLSTHYCGVESATSVIEDLLRVFLFGEVASLSPGRYQEADQLWHGEHPLP